jgi:hypothetical protein
LFYFRSTKLASPEAHFESEDCSDSDDESDTFALAKGYFDLKEFDRSAFFTKGCKQPRNVFLHFYSRLAQGPGPVLVVR